MATMMYTPLSPETLETTARIMGPGSTAAAAYANAAARQEAGEVPICMEVRDTRRNTMTIIVFDAHNPPDELPTEWQDACRQAAATVRKP